MICATRRKRNRFEKKSRGSWIIPFGSFLLEMMIFLQYVEVGVTDNVVLLAENKKVASCRENSVLENAELRVLL